MTQPRPQSVEQTLALAKKAAKQGKTTEAIQLYQSVLQQQPQHTLAKKALKKLQKQGSSLKQSTLTIDNLPQGELNALGQLYQSGDMPTTVSRCRQLLGLYPRSPILFNVLGAALLALKAFDESKQAFDQVILLTPNDVNAYYNRGIALKGLEQYEAAIKSYDQAIQLKPDYEGAYFNRGNALKESGQLLAAIDSYRQAIRLNSTYAEAYYNCGNALKELDRWQEAAECYDCMIVLRPDFAEVYNNRGAVLKELGQKEAAIASLEKALSLDPDSLGADFLLSVLRGETTDRAPKKFVSSLFDVYANRFESHLVSILGYNAHCVVKEAMQANGLADKIYEKAIDLGCGTGLAGVEFASMVNSMVGIDLSEKMVAQAEQKGVYAALYADDLIDRMDVLNEQYDLFIATDVLVYLGDLMPLFTAVKQYAFPEAVFTFSTEHHETTPFLLQETGRYAHSKDYIASVAENSGFELVHFSTFNLRKEREQWLTGGAYIYKLKSA